jgi:hypothetical protein
MRPSLCSFVPLALVALLVTAAQAQEPHYHEGDAALAFDPAVAPQIVPTVDDFLPPPATDPSKDAGASPLALGAFVDVSSDLTMFNFAPWYTFAERFRLKVHVPWIFQRKLEYMDFMTGDPVDATASGLGDITVDAGYTHRFASPGQVLRVQASVKLPTGDDEARDGDYAVPLGTGSTDFMGRVQYAFTGERSGLVATALYRRNTEAESISQGFGMTTITQTTNGDQFAAAAFGRRQAGDRIWLHLGASLMLTGDGEVEEEFRYDDADPDFSSYSLGQKSTLVDLFPGVSYSLGKITPYLGVRIPVVTSYDLDGVDESRDLAVNLQVSYRPERLF